MFFFFCEKKRSFSKNSIFTHFVERQFENDFVNNSWTARPFLLKFLLKVYLLDMYNQ